MSASRGSTTSACHLHFFNTHIPNFDLRNVCVKDMRMTRGCRTSSGQHPSVLVILLSDVIGP